VDPEVEEVLRYRALASLKTTLVSERYRARRGLWDRGQIHQAGLDGRVLALEHVGAITADEAREWRERLGEVTASQDVSPPPDAQTVSRARDHLDKMLGAVRPDAGDAWRACVSAVYAYEHTGVIGPDEALAWRERARTKVGMTPERPPQCSQRNLVRVVAGPPQRISGLRLTSVLLYEDGVQIYWHNALRSEGGPEVPRIVSSLRMRGASSFGFNAEELTDDFGTRHFRTSWNDPYLGIDGGGWTVLFGSAIFTPGVAPESRMLRTAIDEEAVEIPLQ
jgi:hypothetical protein